MPYNEKKGHLMYDTLSSDYDRFVSWPGRLAYEIPFIEQHLRDSARDSSAEPALRVLDAACGTGMHAIALARQGFEVAGADLSGGMIEQARANASAAGVKVDLRVAGFGGLAQTFGSAAAFDGLLCLGNSLPHVDGPGEVEQALADFAACLRPGGVLILQNRNFDSVLANQQRWMEPQAHREGAREWLFVRFYDFEPDGHIQFNILTLTRTGEQAWEQKVTHTRLYPLRQAELTQALRTSGFDEIQAYGSPNGEAFDPHKSGNLILVARRV
jgi:glycine/sarcosine N-methyltransferase